jgi:hypothetical protein
VDHKKGADVEKRTKLTKRVVDAAEPADKRYEIWDSELCGFGLRIEEGGKKSFFVRDRVEGGRRATRRNMTIGTYGAVTPEEARGEAKKILGQAANGYDPADVRNARRREMTVAELVDLYEQKGCVIQHGFREGQPMKPMTKRQTLKRLRNHVVPLCARGVPRCGALHCTAHPDDGIDRPTARIAARATARLCRPDQIAGEERL